jgi:NADH-quinone oxidoreductase subunit E
VFRLDKIAASFVFWDAERDRLITAESNAEKEKRVTESSAIRSAIARYGGRARALIPILQEIQDELRWLSPRTLEDVAGTLNLPLSHVYSVATFYKSFSLEPRGRRTCTVCMGTACHVRGGADILEHFERTLGIRAGQTTPDGEFTLERVNCLGACALAPLVVVDGRYYGRMDEAKAQTVLNLRIK